MPIYEYLCDKCETRFERIVINKQQEISCPKCASKKATIQLSVFATANGSSNGSSAKSSSSSSGGGGGGCGRGFGSPLIAQGPLPPYRVASPNAGKKRPTFPT